MIAIHLEGAAREAVVKADLLCKGFEVFGAEGGNSSFDLVAYKFGMLLRIEVKGTRKCPRTSPFAHTGSKEGGVDCYKCDVVAGVSGNSVKYVRSIFHMLNSASKELVGKEIQSNRTSHSVLKRRAQLLTNVN